MSAGQSFEDFYEAEFVPLVRYAQLNGARRDDAEVIAQEAMVQAWRRWHTLTDPRAWVRVAVNNHIINVIRKRIREEGLLRALGSDIAAGGETAPAADRAAGWEDVRRLIATLPPAQREVMALTCDGYAPREIAEMLGKGRDAVRANLREARKRLREKFPLEPAHTRADLEEDEKGDSDV